MTATNTAPNAPSASLYRPIETKRELAELIRDSLVGADPSRKQDLLYRLSASNSSVWPDPCHVAS